MEKMRKCITLFIGMTFFLVLCSTHLVYADTADATIEATATVTGENVVITGCVSNANEKTELRFLVGNPENTEGILYIDQKFCDSLGRFTFDFILPDNLPGGTYQYKISTDTVSSPYKGTFTYQSIRQSRKIIDGTMNLIIDSYTPRIEGSIECGIGKNVTINITNTTDNIIVANDIIFAANGVCDISYVLPSLILANDYTVTISCNDYEKNMATIQLAVSSSILLVSASGTISTAENVTLNLQLKSVASEFIDESMTVNGTKTLSGDTSKYSR